MDEGEVLSTTLTASDADGDNLTFTSVNLPAGALLTNVSTSTATLDWTTDFNDAGVYVVDVTVEDTGTPPLSATSSLTITVNDTPQLPLVSDKLNLGSTSTAYSPTPRTNAPAGVFTINATFQNTSAESLTTLQFKVEMLTNGNLLLNADGAPSGADAILSVPPTALGNDGILTPNESFMVTFEIGLATRQPFALFVDAYGLSSVTTSTVGASVNKQPTRRASDVFSFTIQWRDLGSQLYLPALHR